MGRALILNATYEPLAIVPARRATVLVLAEKAEMVQATDRMFHSQRLTVVVPSVVRLRRFVRVPYHRRLAVSRRAVMARDNGACQYCGRFADSIDHVVPRSRGGTHVWENVVAACRACNLRKRDRLVHEAGMRLHRQPGAPIGSAWLYLAAGSVPGDWLPFLGGPLAEPRCDGVTLGGWAVERLRGSAAELHHLDWPSPVTRTVWLLEIERPALVLGSGQPETDVDRDAVRAAGLDLARRRSGGGAVLLVPGEAAWIDVVVPAGDSLWSDDVRLAFHWLGDVWVEALASLGLAGRVHRGAMVASEWSRRVCFAGLGPGEVVMASATAPKVVGLSQRRTRHGARLQSMVHRRSTAAATVELLALPDGERDTATADLGSRVAVVDAPVRAIEEAFLTAL